MVHLLVKANEHGIFKLGLLTIMGKARVLRFCRRTRKDVSVRREEKSGWRLSPRLHRPTQGPTCVNWLPGTTHMCLAITAPLFCGWVMEEEEKNTIGRGHCHCASVRSKFHLGELTFEYHRRWHVQQACSSVQPILPFHPFHSSRVACKIQATLG